MNYKSSDITLNAAALVMNERKIDLDSHQITNPLVVWRDILTDNCDILWYDFCGSVMDGEKTINLAWETWEYPTDMEPLCWL